MSRLMLLPPVVCGTDESGVLRCTPAAWSHIVTEAIYA